LDNLIEKMWQQTNRLLHSAFLQIQARIVTLHCEYHWQTLRWQ